ncbi:MAG: hypothetical protein V3S22_05960 [Candidatus Neomarinimicrobiota bacterium]
MIVKTILIILLTQAWIYAQEERPDWTLLPELKQDSIFVGQDTLELKQKNALIKLNKKFYAGMGIMVFSAAAAWKFHEQADKAYSNYLREGDLSKINSHYNRARKNDRYTVISYMGIQTGIVLTIRSLFK